MVNVLASCAVYRGFDPRSGQTNDYTIGSCCFSPAHATLRRMNKTGHLGIRIICASGVTCLLADCCFSGLSLLYENN